jgi:hypothetical protein
MNPQKNANCKILGDGSNAADSAHVSKNTPLDLKRREFKDAEKYHTDLNAGIDTKRQTATRNARSKKNVRPLGGG